jgi:cellulose biosynthesis protein BcsQ
MPNRQEISMRVVTAYSHKGGTGKTTSLMMLASAIDAANQSALLVDCDPHQSFKAYQTYSLQAGPDRWSSSFETRFLDYETTPLLTLEDHLLDADESGRYDWCLINLAGINHPFNRHVLRYAEVTLMPFAPSALDLMELPGALDVLRQLARDGEVGEARVVLTKMKSRMTAAQRDYIGEILGGFPHLDTQIRETAILGDLVMRGLLSRTLTAAEQDAVGLQRAEIKRLADALEDCKALLGEVETLIEQGAAA